MRAYEHFAQLRGSPAAGGWLKTVTTHLTLNHLSRYRRRWRLFSELRTAEAGDDSAPDIEVPVPDTLLADVGAEQRPCADRCGLAKTAPAAARAAGAVPLRRPCPYEEIAIKLHVSLAKVKDRYPAPPRRCAAAPS